jgi:hypothetical protein
MSWEFLTELSRIVRYVWLHVRHGWILIAIKSTQPAKPKETTRYITPGRPERFRRVALWLPALVAPSFSSTCGEPGLLLLVVRGRDPSSMSPRANSARRLLVCGVPAHVSQQQNC